MSKRFNNRNLLFILGGLVLILLLTILIKVPERKATLKEKLIELDSTAVSKILLSPKNNEGNVIEFYRSQGKWMVKQGEIISSTEKNAVQNIMRDISDLKPQRLAATDKAKWEEYELTDSLATRVKILNEKGKILADLMIGKFSFRQTNNPYGRYGGGTSFVRISGKKEVYAVDGFLPFTFNRKFNDWRDKTFIQLNTSDLTKISFKCPGDSSFILAIKDSVWYAGNIPADSAVTADYLNNIKWLDGDDFRDGFKPVADPPYQLQIEGNNLLNINVKCYTEGDKYILNSSLNPDVYYVSERSGLYDKLFKPLNYFVPKGKKK